VNGTETIAFLLPFFVETSAELGRLAEKGVGRLIDAIEVSENEFGGSLAARLVGVGS